MNDCNELSFDCKKLQEVISRNINLHGPMENANFHLFGDGNLRFCGIFFVKNSFI